MLFAQVKNTVGTEKYQGNTAEVCEGKSSSDCAGSSRAMCLNSSGTSKFAGAKEILDDDGLQALSVSKVLACGNKYGLCVFKIEREVDWMDSSIQNIKSRRNVEALKV